MSTLLTYLLTYLLA